MLLDERPNPPSLVQTCCFCSLNERRVISGLAEVPELRGLAGITMQVGGGAENNVQTAKWATFDPKARIAITRNVSGAVCCGMCASSQLSTWVVGLPKGCPFLCCLSFSMSMCQRQCDCGYKFIFDESYSRADIKILVNCCPCIPCVPAWCQLPDSLVKFEMVQEVTDGRMDGSHWIRNSSQCGGPMKKTYDLKEVFLPDGSPGRFHHSFVENAPKVYYMNR